MAPSSRRRVLFALLCSSAMPLVLACNGIIGLSDYKRGECSGGGICTDGGDVDVSVDAPPDGNRKDAMTVDASGTKPVSWAQFVMPNYAQDGGPGENVPEYTSTDGGLFDSVSELVWREPMPDADKGPKSWGDAQKVCAALGDGERKWRLPSRIELVTLLDLSRSGAKINPAFPSTEPREYWTFSEVRLVGGGVSGERWTVDFKNGGLGKQPTTGGEAAVRCIEDQ